MPINKKYKKKQSQKHSVSELINPSKTKKNYKPTNSSIFDKHFKDVNKNKKDKINIHSHSHSQSGGKTSDVDAKYTAKFENVDSKSLDVANKVQYNILKSDIKGTIRLAWINSKIGRIKNTQYELIKRLSKANLFFSRMKLENAKMLLVLEKLIRDEESGLKTIQNMIRKIFNLQRVINKGYLDPADKGLFKKNLLKKIQKIIKKAGKDKYRLITKLIQKQDEIRSKLMKLTMFDSDKDLSTKCDWTYMGVLSFGKERSFKTTKKIICLLGRYRKLEGRFNKYYNKFNRQYDLFIAENPLCKGLIQNIKIFEIDIESDAQKQSSFFDITKCNSENVAEDYNKVFKLVTDASSVQLSDKYLEKKQEKSEALSESYMVKTKNFATLMESFNKRLKVFKDLFNAGEYYGIHYYSANLPKKKKFLKGLDRTLINPEQLTALSADPLFINEFKTIMGTLSVNMSEIINNPDNTEKPDRQISASIVPSISVLTTALTNINVISLNFAKYNLSAVADPFNNIYTTLQIDKIIISRSVTPHIICVQNCLKNMIINFDSTGTDEFYIPISYSYHGSENDKVAERKYNVIYIKNKILAPTIYPNYDKISNVDVATTKIIPIDQSKYFILPYIPAGMNSFDAQKSFTIANLVESTSGFNNGITIVNTELIGSDPEKDLKYIREINNFSVKIKGIRANQISKILKSIYDYSGKKQPDIFCGDFGGIIDTYYTTIKANVILEAKKILKTFKNLKNIKDVEIDTFYKNGMSLIINMNQIIPAVTMVHTKKADNSISNYIFIKTLSLVTNYGLINNSTIDDYGGILPIGTTILSLPLSPINTPKQFTRQQNTVSIKDVKTLTKLYDEKGLKKIIRMLDKLMGNFAYGYKAFLKRDLGCFSFEQSNDYGKRIYKGAQNTLKTFYSMNYPSFIEVFLFQLSGFFNNKTGQEYYSENQIALGTNFNADVSKKLNLFYNENKIDAISGKPIREELPQDHMDVIIRMLLIPSSDLKSISGIDIKEKISAKDYIGLTRLFCSNFYRDVVLVGLEARITEMMVPIGTTDLPESTLNFVDELLALDSAGHLVNISDPKKSVELIRKLFEFVFIMLKLKYIDRTLEKVGQIEKPFETGDVKLTKQLYDAALASVTTAQTNLIANIALAATALTEFEDAYITRVDYLTKMLNLHTAHTALNKSADDFNAAKATLTSIEAELNSMLSSYVGGGNDDDGGGDDDDDDDDDDSMFGGAPPSSPLIKKEEIQPMLENIKKILGELNLSISKVQSAINKIVDNVTEKINKSILKDYEFEVNEEYNKITDPAKIAAISKNKNDTIDNYKTAKTEKDKVTATSKPSFTELTAILTKVKTLIEIAETNFEIVKVEADKVTNNDALIKTLKTAAEKAKTDTDNAFAKIQPKINEIKTLEIKEAKTDSATNKALGSTDADYVSAKLLADAAIKVAVAANQLNTDLIKLYNDANLAASSATKAAADINANLTAAGDVATQAAADAATASAAIVTVKIADVTAAKTKADKIEAAALLAASSAMDKVVYSPTVKNQLDLLVAEVFKAKNQEIKAKEQYDLALLKLAEVKAKDTAANAEAVSKDFTNPNNFKTKAEEAKNLAVSAKGKAETAKTAAVAAERAIVSPPPRPAGDAKVNDYCTAQIDMISSNIAAIIKYIQDIEKLTKDADADIKSKKAAEDKAKADATKDAKAEKKRKDALATALQAKTDAETAVAAAATAATVVTAAATAAAAAKKAKENSNAFTEATRLAVEKTVAEAAEATADAARLAATKIIEDLKTGAETAIRELKDTTTKIDETIKNIDILYKAENTITSATYKAKNNKQYEDFIPAKALADAAILVADKAKGLNNELKTVNTTLETKNIPFANAALKAITDGHYTVTLKTQFDNLTAAIAKAKEDKKITENIKKTEEIEKNARDAEKHAMGKIQYTPAVKDKVDKVIEAADNALVEKDKAKTIFYNADISKQTAEKPDTTAAKAQEELDKFNDYLANANVAKTKIETTITTNANSAATAAKAAIPAGSLLECDKKAEDTCKKETEKIAKNLKIVEEIIKKITEFQTEIGPIITAKQAAEAVAEKLKKDIDTAKKAVIAETEKIKTNIADTEIIIKEIKKLKEEEEKPDSATKKATTILKDTNTNTYDEIKAASTAAEEISKAALELKAKLETAIAALNFQIGLTENAAKAITETPEYVTVTDPLAPLDTLKLHADTALEEVKKAKALILTAAQSVTDAQKISEDANAAVTHADEELKKFFSPTVAKELEKVNEAVNSAKFEEDKATKANTASVALKTAAQAAATSALANDEVAKFDGFLQIAKNAKKAIDDDGTGTHVGFKADAEKANVDAITARTTLTTTGTGTTPEDAKIEDICKAEIDKIIKNIANIEKIIIAIPQLKAEVEQIVTDKKAKEAAKVAEAVAAVAAAAAAAAEKAEEKRKNVKLTDLFKLIEDIKKSIQNYTDELTNLEVTTDVSSFAAIIQQINAHKKNITDKKAEFVKKTGKLNVTDKTKEYINAETNLNNLYKTNFTEKEATATALIASKQGVLDKITKIKETLDELTKLSEDIIKKNTKLNEIYPKPEELIERGKKIITDIIDTLINKIKAFIITYKINVPGVYMSYQLGGGEQEELDKLYEEVNAAKDLGNAFLAEALPGADPAAGAPGTDPAADPAADPAGAPTAGTTADPATLLELKKQNKEHITDILIKITDEKIKKIITDLNLNDENDKTDIKDIIKLFGKILTLLKVFNLSKVDNYIKFAEQLNEIYERQKTYYI